jgi:hypothetical protein
MESWIKIVKISNGLIMMVKLEKHIEKFNKLYY